MVSVLRMNLVHAMRNSITASSNALHVNAQQRKREEFFIMKSYFSTLHISYQFLGPIQKQNAWHFVEGYLSTNFSHCFFSYQFLFLIVKCQKNYDLHWPTCICWSTVFLFSLHHVFAEVDTAYYLWFSRLVTFLKLKIYYYIIHIHVKTRSYLAMK